MNAQSFDDRAAAWARHLEDEEARSLGVPLALAREVVARRLSIPKGTLENLRRNRVKGVRAWIFERLRSAYEAERQRQLRQLTHELELTRAIAGAGHDSVAQAQALVDTANGSEI